MRAKTDEFRERLAKGEVLENLIPEAFAVVREASKRVFGMRHFDVQLLGGMVLNERCIAEMRTGEGKTLTATLPAYLNALVAVACMWLPSTTIWLNVTPKITAPCLSFGAEHWYQFTEYDCASQTRSLCR